MSEKQKPFEHKEVTEPTPRPNLLDVVKIDDRWTQVIYGGNTVRYLDDKSEVRINWNDYTCQTFDKHKWMADLVKENQITHDEYMVVHWGPEEEQDPTCRDNVMVFGIYTRKK